MRSSAIFPLMLCLCACTQAPAPVDNKGGGFYGRDGHGGDYRARSTNPNDLQVEPRYYPANSPRLKEGHTTQAEPATLDNVGVSELPPPVQSKELSPPKPQSALPPLKNTAVATAVSAPVVSQTPLLKKPPAIQPLDFTVAEPSLPRTSARMIWPAEGKVISKFGSKGEGRSNDGINIAASEGEPIYAAADGKVTYVGNALKGYGNMALIEHANHTITSYAHASELKVKKDEQVKQGQVIGYVGKTGSVDTAQLHFSVRQGKTPVDPLPYLG